MKQVDTGSNSSISSHEFNWVDLETPDSHAYLAPDVLSEIRKIVIKYPGKQLKMLDLGCGNGVFSARLASEGGQVNAYDHSISGVEVAKNQFPKIDFFQQDINKELPEQYKGQFDIVVSLEVIEHPLRDFGHIKFFSKNPLLQCVPECGFEFSSFHRV